jgi:hypothetical protein
LFYWEIFMRVSSFGVVYLLVAARAAVAAEPMAPSDIQATFFNGQPFTASTVDGTPSAGNGGQEEGRLEHPSPTTSRAASTPGRRPAARWGTNRVRA